MAALPPLTHLLGHLSVVLAALAVGYSTTSMLCFTRLRSHKIYASGRRSPPTAAPDLPSGQGARRRPADAPGAAPSAGRRRDAASAAASFPTRPRAGGPVAFAPRALQREEPPAHWTVDVCEGMETTFGGEGGNAGLFVRGFAAPFLLLSCLLHLFRARNDLPPRRCRARDKVAPCLPGSGGGAADPPLTLWSVGVIGIPCLITCLDPLLATASWEEVPAKYAKKWVLTPSSSWGWVLLRSQANPAGYAACLALAFFLVPVSRHSVFNRVLGLSFPQALVFHRMAGWISLFFAVEHALLYSMVYGLEGDRDFFQNVVEALIPARECWTRDILRYSYQDDCYEYLRNFFGLLSMTAFLVLAAFSLPKVRRAAYRWFYLVHIPAAWVMLVSAIVHHPKIVLFLLPTIVYYLAATVPAWARQHLRARGAGVPARDAVSLARRLPADAGGCVVLRFRVDPARLREAARCGAAVRLCAPIVAAGAWHPFSVVRREGRGEVELLFRASGPWTRRLAERLCPPPARRGEAAPPSPRDNGGPPGAGAADDVATPVVADLPTLLVDGFYGTEYAWLHRSLHHHDVCLFVAGGVGIVPFLNLVPELYRLISKGAESSTVGLVAVRYVQLHWYCREPALFQYVYDEYWANFLGAATSRPEIRNGVTAEDEEKGVGATPPLCEINLHVHLTCHSPEDPAVEVGVSAGTTSPEADQPAARLDCHGVRQPTAVLDIDKRLGGDQLQWNAFTTFTAVAVLGFVIHWWQYGLLSADADGRRPVFAKAYGTILIGGAALVVGAIAAAVGLRTPKEGRPDGAPHPSPVGGNHDHHEEDGLQLPPIELKPRGDEDVYDNEAEATTPANPRLQTPALNGSGDSTVGANAVRLSLRVSNGRPFVSDVIAPAVNAERPGACFCGPLTLRDGLKRAIASERRSVRGRLAAPCRFYDEFPEL